MAEVDPKDVQAFNELQPRLIDVTEKQKFAQQQYSSAQSAKRRAELTAAELEQLPDSTPTYEAAGKAYFLAPRLQLHSSLKDQAAACSLEVSKSKETQEGLVRAMKQVEEEVKELLHNSPALARAFAAV